ncbi:histidine kinase [Lysinibacillus irui]|uniref:Histidine kinase n=1 Tax=Lysinibacillus irui TaxID=2998077 RepID=A0AAJ5UVY2_9BACI|nr:MULTISPECIES: histidine kinase [Lysinibacillus]MEA0556287.1 histidine kinase [Lysinibacillus irui]MEA0562774.1 histidine kinase [Lysinibacillus irui]MEA0977360.1 histidine kinase [Lysinibacillus irui]MEA1043514.1 histidine kinase [Lysinibacillus irui]WDV07060.1 histidine kinase [Lysinibacillus irui]
MKHVKGRLDESILVCVYYGLNGERLIRRGHKMASMLDCPLYILSVDSQPLDAFDAEKSSYIEQWKKLSDELEVEKFILQDNEKRPIQKVIAEVAKNYGISQIIVGQSAQSRWEEITKGSFLNVLLKEVPFVDFHIVAVQRPTDDDANETYEKGVRAYLIKEQEDFKVAFTCPKYVSIEGIFFKEIGTDFDNGIFKFTYNDKMHEVHISEGYVIDQEKLPAEFLAPLRQ